MLSAETLFVVLQYRDCNLKLGAVGCRHSSRLTITMKNRIKVHDIMMIERLAITGYCRYTLMTAHGLGSYSNMSSIDGLCDEHLMALKNLVSVVIRFAKSCLKCFGVKLVLRCTTLWC